LKKPVFITGMPGSGKTTIGKLVAYDLSVPFYDLDKLIELSEKKSIPSIFKDQGEEYFRKVENTTLLDFLKKHESEVYVLSLGGGTICFYDCIKTIKQYGVLVYLETQIEQLYMRLKYDTNARAILPPTFDPSFMSHLESLLEKRKPFYSKANFTIQTNTDKHITMADIVEIVGR
jgi:shikimate kinase